MPREGVKEAPPYSGEHNNITGRASLSSSSCSSSDSTSSIEELTSAAGSAAGSVAAADCATRARSLPTSSNSRACRRVDVQCSMVV